MITHELGALDSYFGSGIGIDICSTPSQIRVALAGPADVRCHMAKAPFGRAVGLNGDGSKEEEGDDLDDLHVCQWKILERRNAKMLRRLVEWKLSANWCSCYGKTE
jgi:hypothetical protein